MLTNEVETYHLCLGFTTIGKIANIVLEGEGLENVHSLIKFCEDDQTFHILDVKTHHGTFVNRERLDMCFRKLNNGDVIQFGKREKTLTFLVTPAPPAKQEVAVDEETKGPMAVSELNELFERASQMCSISLEMRSKAVGDQRQASFPPVQRKTSFQRAASLQNQRLSLQRQQQRLSSQREQQQEQLSKHQKNETTFVDAGSLELVDLYSETPTDIADLPDESFKQLFMPPSRGRPNMKIKETIENIETNTVVKDLLSKVDGYEERNAKLNEIIKKMEAVIYSKDESLRIMAQAADKTRKENACLEIQNEALLNSVSRKYADCDGCRREDLMIQKDMENVKLRVQVQLNVDKVEELKKCTACMNKELEKLRQENAQLKKVLKTAGDEITDTRRSSDQFQKAEMLGRMNMERMLKQLELLKKPVLEMVNIFCSDEKPGEARFQSIENICQFKGMPLTSTPLTHQGPSIPNDSARNEGKSSKGTIEGNKTNNEWSSNQCLEYGLAQVPVIDNTDEFIKAADECLSKMKKLKCQKQLFQQSESANVDQKQQPLTVSAPAALNAEKKESKRKKK